MKITKGAVLSADEKITTMKNLEEITQAQLDYLLARGEKNLSRMNMHGLVLRDRDLRYFGLKDSDLSNSDLRGANLAGANLRGANIVEADLTGANLKEADLTGANLWGADLTRASLKEADLSEADLSESNLAGANLTEVDLTGADITDARIDGAIFRRADLRNIKMSDVAGRVDFVWSRLFYARITQGEIYALLDQRRKNLSRMDMHGSVFRDFDLRDCDFRNSDLRDCDFRNSDLRGADFTGADLSGSDLSSARVDGAIFRRADLRNIKMPGMVGRADFGLSRLSDYIESVFGRLKNKREG